MRILFFLMLVAIALPANAALPDNFGSVTVDEVTSIYDADTFRVNIKGWPPIIGLRVPIRILGVDAPELRGKCDIEKDLARKARQHTVAALRAGKVIELHDMRRDKYFRILARVTIDGMDLGKDLIKQSLAVPYDGGTKPNWCGQ